MYDFVGSLAYPFFFINEDFWLYLPPMVLDTEAEEAGSLDTITMSSSNEHYSFSSPGSYIPMESIYSLCKNP